MNAKIHQNRAQDDLNVLDFSKPDIIIIIIKLTVIESQIARLRL
jgi:hypothetical protein